MLKELVSAITFVSIDSIYLNLIKDYFSKQVQMVQGSPMKLNLTAALIVYIFLIFGLNYFIISQNKSPQDAFLLGLVIYGTYDFTTLALLKDWKLMTAIIDTLWGGVLFYLSTIIVYKLKKIFGY